MGPAHDIWSSVVQLGSCMERAVNIEDHTKLSVGKSCLSPQLKAHLSQFSLQILIKNENRKFSG